MTLAVPLDAATAAHGGKVAMLARLRRLGLPVPDGFVVPAAVVDDDLAAAVLGGLDELAGTGAPADAALAVRSSATDEDGPAASAAGQYDSVLGVVGADAVVAAVRACRASVSGQRAVAYRAAMRRPGASAPSDTLSDELSDEPGVAVLVQRLVDARAAGVLFTGDGRTVIEASWGLGESVVQGAVDPDRFTVVDGRVADRRTGSKHTRVDRSPDGTTTRDVPDPDRSRPCLDDEGVLRVAALGGRVAALLGGPQDVEWAVDDDGTAWLLQARPVTAPLPGAGCGREIGDYPGPDSPRSHAHNETGVLRGAAGSGGRASGPVRVVCGPDDFAAVRPGDVLICRETNPAWTPLFGVVAAVVTETGGLLSHAAIVARELRLPAVLGVPGVVEALAVLPSGTAVAVDGDAGTVTPDGPVQDAGSTRPVRTA